MLLNPILGIAGTPDPFANNVVFQLETKPSGTPVYRDVSQNRLLFSTVAIPIITATPIGGSSASVDTDGSNTLRVLPNTDKGVTFTFRESSANVDFCVEFWMRADAGYGTDDGLLSNSGTTTSRWAFYLTSTTLDIYGDGDVIILTNTHATDVDLLDGNAHHIAWTRQGNSNSLWVDGTLIDTYDDGGHSYGDTGQTLCIGEDFSNAARKWVNGVIDGVRITHSARYTATFTPPTLPLPKPTAPVNIRDLAVCKYRANATQVVNTPNTNVLTVFDTEVFNDLNIDIVDPLTGVIHIPDEYDGYLMRIVNSVEIDSDRDYALRLSRSTNSVGSYTSIADIRTNGNHNNAEVSIKVSSGHIFVVNLFAASSNVTVQNTDLTFVSVILAKEGP